MFGQDTEVSNCNMKTQKLRKKRRMKQFISALGPFVYAQVSKDGLLSPMAGCLRCLHCCEYYPLIIYAEIRV